MTPVQSISFSCDSGDRTQGSEGCMAVRMGNDWLSRISWSSFDSVKIIFCNYTHELIYSQTIIIL